MYFQFLIEDQSTEILVGHVMEKLKEKYPDKGLFISMCGIENWLKTD